MGETIRFIKRIVYDYKHRNFDPDVCCCGSVLADHTGWENHNFVSMKEHYRP